MQAVIYDSEGCLLFQNYTHANRYIIDVQIMMHFKAVLKSKFATFWHISEGTFYHKHIKFVGTLIFTIKNRLAFSFFNKYSGFLKKWWQSGHFETFLLCFSKKCPCKPPISWHTSEVSFDRKCIKIIDILN